MYGVTVALTVADVSYSWKNETYGREAKAVLPDFQWAIMGVNWLPRWWSRQPAVRRP